jgi:hypothetical protein
LYDDFGLVAATIAIIDDRSWVADIASHGIQCKNRAFGI